MIIEYDFETIRKTLKGYVVYVRVNEDFFKILDNFLIKLGIQNPFKIGNIIRFDDYAFYLSSEEEVRQRKLF